MRKEDATDKNQMTSLAKGLEVILALGQGKCSSITELTRETGMNRWLIRRILLTLESLGYVRREGRTIRLQPKIMDLGYAYLSNQNIWKIASPLLVELVDTVGLSTTMSVLEGRDIVYLFRRTSSRSLIRIPIQVGTRIPAHCTASGRVLLGQLSDPALNEWLYASPLPSLTEQTETDPERLRLHILEDRARGWSRVDNELAMGSCAIAMGVHDRSGALVASVSLSGSDTDISRQEVQDALASTVHRLESILNMR